MVHGMPGDAFWLKVLSAGPSVGKWQEGDLQGHGGDRRKGWGSLIPKQPLWESSPRPPEEGLQTCVFFLERIFSLATQR